MGYYFGKKGWRDLCKKECYLAPHKGYAVGNHLTLSFAHGFKFVRPVEPVHRFNSQLGEFVVSVADVAQILECKSERRAKRVLLRGFTFKSGSAYSSNRFSRSGNYLLALANDCVPADDFDYILSKIEGRLNDGLYASQRRADRVASTCATLNKSEATAKTAAAQLRALGILA